MTFFVPLMLFGWVPFTIIIFNSLKPHRAVLVCVIGGVLFLPQMSYDFSGFPSYSKSTAIALGLILGGRLSGARTKVSIKLTQYDIPMLIWCFCPLVSSLSNLLGLHDGLSSTFSQIITWGVPYLAGRLYFEDTGTIKDLCLGIIIGGLIYAPLCLFEVRFSPQLCKKIYGFFPHSWAQHFRQGGFRPIVFMQHGLMVSLWIAVSAIATFWLCKAKQLVHIKGIPAPIIFIGLLVTCILCKSVNGLFTVIVGCSLDYAGGKLNNKRAKAVTLLLWTIPAYIIFRTNGIVTIDDLAQASAHFVNEERIASLTYRLRAEDLFFQKALEHLWFGWGGFDRGKPLDPETGEVIQVAIDSIWLITMRSRGIVGLLSLYSGMLLGPWLVLKQIRRGPATDRADLPLLILTLIVVLFMIDSLLNGMLNPTYILISGALLGNYLATNAKTVNYDQSNEQK